MSATVPVLTYHAIADEATPIAVAPAVFADTMRAMRAAGWRTVGDEVVLRGLKVGAWPARTFVLHFDDGFASVRTHAAPVLAECDFSATIFVVTDWVGRDNGWPSQPATVPRWPLLDWGDLRRLQSAGFRVASHTVSHPRLTELAPGTLTAELRDSTQRVADEIGVRSPVFAFPYGVTDPDVEVATGRHYEGAFGTELAFVTPDSHPMRLPRVDAWYLTPTLAATLDQPAVRAYLAARRVLRRVRRR